jgi:hypothetical protein
MNLDRLKSALERTVVALVGHRLDYLAFYEAAVVAQNGDGSLDVRGDDPRIGDIAHVPIRYGLPGVTVVTGKGARVLVGFEGGDPRRPIASFWDGGGIKELRFGGVAAVARVGDPVTFTLPTAPLPISGVCPAGVFTGTITAPPTSVSGKISTGSAKVKAG